MIARPVSSAAPSAAWVQARTASRNSACALWGAAHESDKHIVNHIVKHEIRRRARHSTKPGSPEVHHE